MIELINDDCLKVMDKMIKDGVQVDCIITDPPYKLENHGGGKAELAQRKLVKEKHIDFISNSFDYNEIFSRFLKLQDIANILIFCSNKQVSSIMKWFEDKKLSTTLLVWNKTNPAPLCNGKHVSDLEFIVYVRGKGATFNNNVEFSKKKKLYTSPVTSKKNRVHPTQKPIELIKQYIELHTNVGDLVFDPYGGGGTTAKGCQDLQRDCISIEINVDYFKASEERITPQQQELF